MAFTGDLFSSPGTDFTGQTISFDVKVDAASATDAFGNNGYLQFVVRNTGGYAWVGQSAMDGNVNDANGWVTVSAPASGTVDAVRALTLQLYGGGGQNLQGDVTLYIDNIKIVPEPGAPMLVALGALGAFIRRRRR